MSWLERLVDRISDQIPEEEEKKSEWVNPNPTLARYIPDDTKLLVVHPKSMNIFWLKVEETIKKGGDINIVGRRPGILNSKRISIAGNTRVKPVDHVKSFGSE